MVSTVLFCIILFLIFDVILFYWIFKMRNTINNYQLSESAICPLYFCDQYSDPSTGILQPGSLCYTNTTGPNNSMVAYRYNNSNQTSYQCQNSLIQDNVILTDQTYLPQSQL